MDVSRNRQYKKVGTLALVIVSSVAMGLVLPWWLYGVFAVVLVVVRSYFVGPLLGALTHDIVYGSVAFGDADIQYVLSLGVLFVAGLVLLLKPRLLHT